MIRLITFSNFYDHINPLLIKLKILKLHDLVFYHNEMFMYDFYDGNLPETFNNFFLAVNQKHNYNTRLASRSSYSLPKIRTNYGKFNIRFSGVKVWNEIDDKTSLKFPKFKTKVKNYLLDQYTLSQVNIYIYIVIYCCNIVTNNCNFFYFFLFKQYFELAIIPKAQGLSREFLLHHYRILKENRHKK